MISLHRYVVEDISTTVTQCQKVVICQCLYIYLRHCGVENIIIVLCHKTSQSTLLYVDCIHLTITYWWHWQYITHPRDVRLAHLFWQIMSSHSHLLKSTWRSLYKLFKTILWFPTLFFAYFVGNMQDLVIFIPNNH